VTLTRHNAVGIRESAFGKQLIPAKKPCGLQTRRPFSKSKSAFENGSASGHSMSEACGGLGLTSDSVSVEFKI
jgi:hypothetical protein